MRKYWCLFKSNLSASLEYRGSLFTWIIVELVILTSSVFVWSAIFRTNSLVGGYDFTKIISYYLLVPIIGGLTSIYVSEHLPKKIKNGEISPELMKPYSIAISSLINQLSIKLTQLTIKFPIYIIIGFIITISLKINFSLSNLLLAILVCVFAYILHFSIDIFISYLAFWFDDVWSLSHLKFICLMIFGGLTFPLDLLPANFISLFNFLPFRFLYYIPIKVAQGAMTTERLLIELGQLVLWTIGFLIIGHILWKLGLKKYGAYGN